MPFKVGDIVRIRQYLDPECEVGINSEMKKLSGRIDIIKEVSDEGWGKVYYLKNTMWQWQDCLLEKAEVNYDRKGFDLGYFDGNNIALGRYVDGKFFVLGFDTESLPMGFSVVNIRITEDIPSLKLKIGDMVPAVICCGKAYVASNPPFLGLLQPSEFCKGR